MRQESPNEKDSVDRSAAALRVLSYSLLTNWMMVFAPMSAQAQLVADGGINILDGVSTNLNGDITVGTNGSFTFLLLTNSATVTNTGNSIIGSAATAKSNAVVVADTGSVWDCPIGFYVGAQGTANTLSILDGGVVTNQFAIIGNNSSANSNVVVVSGAGSFWNMQWTTSSQFGTLRVGSSGSFNQLLVTNGGVVADGFARIGENFSSSNNVAIVTGRGSVWSHLADLYFGDHGRNNQLIVTNGGTVLCGRVQVGIGGGGNNRVTVTGQDSLCQNTAVYINSGPSNVFAVDSGGAVLSSGNCTLGFYGHSNTVLVADSESLWTNQSITIGYGGKANLLIISNGAVTVSEQSQIGANPGAGPAGNAALVTGPDSLWTNSSDFYVGYGGSSNQLVVANGGTLANNIGYIGYNGFDDVANQALVTDTNSTWTNRSDLYVGYNSARSQLVLSRAGKVYNRDGYVGYNSSSVSNLVFVTDAGSSWSNQFNLYVGYGGAVNQLVVSNAGLVGAKHLYVGFDSTSTNNLVTLAGGNLFVTNFGSGRIEVRRGIVTVNSGLIRADNILVLNRALGKIAFNGGTLQVFGAYVDNGGPFVVGDGTNVAIYELLLPGGTQLFANGLTLSSNALLQGCGTIQANLNVGSGATVSPGSSDAIGFITVTKGITLSDGSTTVMKLDAFSGAADHFDGATNVAFGGTLRLTNILGSLGDGNLFKLFNASQFTGAFSSLSPASPGSGLKWNTNQLNVDGTLRVFSVPTPPPTITDVSLLSGSVVICSSNGIPYDPCYLLTSTNVASPLAEWFPCATNRFDSAGNVSITNAAALDEPQRFYRLSVE